MRIPARLSGATLLLVAAGALVLGCKSENPNAPGRVSGKVTYNGQPVTGGTVTFHSKKDGAKIPVSISSDGRYSAFDIPDGEMDVTVETESLNPDREAAAATTGEELPVDRSTRCVHAASEEPGGWCQVWRVAFGGDEGVGDGLVVRVGPWRVGAQEWRHRVLEDRAEVGLVRQRERRREAGADGVLGRDDREDLGHVQAVARVRPVLAGDLPGGVEEDAAEEVGEPGPQRPRAEAVVEGDDGHALGEQALPALDDVGGGGNGSAGRPRARRTPGRS